MEEKKKGLPEVKRLNRVKIKKYIYRNAPVTRVEMAKTLGFTLPTVTTSVADMLTEGILQEQPLPESAVINPLGGRKPLMLEFNAKSAYALGVELGPYKTTVCAVDLHGAFQIQHAYEPADEDYNLMLNQLSIYVQEAARHLPQDKILGLGVGLPGFIKSESGVVRSNPRSGWNGHNLASDLEKILKIPVIIDNNVRMRAVGEELFTREWRPDIFAYFYISKGIACPLMLKEDVISGFAAGSGEIGHTMVQKSGPICTTCGHRGCLDAVAGETAILAACQKLCSEGKAPTLAKLLAGDSGGVLDMKKVLKAQRAGDHDVDMLLQDVVEYLGISLANVVNLINPGQVVVDGYIMKNNINRQRLLETATRYLYGLNVSEVKFKFLPFLLYRGAWGCTARVIQKKFLEK